MLHKLSGSIFIQVGADTYIRLHTPTLLWWLSIFSREKDCINTAALTLSVCVFLWWSISISAHYATNYINIPNFSSRWTDWPAQWRRRTCSADGSLSVPQPPRLPRLTHVCWLATCPMEETMNCTRSAQVSIQFLNVWNTSFFKHKRHMQELTAYGHSHLLGNHPECIINQLKTLGTA